MKVIIFGATGMVGQSVLRECLSDPEIEGVLAVVRVKRDMHHPKVRELVHDDFMDFSARKPDFFGYKACFYCLGMTSAGMNEEAYARVTYSFTMAAAKTLVEVCPEMTFIFTSAVGADSTERGRSMWARVKGRTENEILKLPFKGKYVIRPAFIQPLDGIKSRTRMYTFFYRIVRPLLPLLRLSFGNYITTTRTLGQTMIHVAKHGASKPILEGADLNRA